MPLPALVRPPLPVSAVAKLTLLPLVSKVAPPEPMAASCAEISLVFPAAHCRPPPFTVIVPVPNAAGQEIDQAAGHRRAAGIAVVSGEDEGARARLAERAGARDVGGDG